MKHKHTNMHIKQTPPPPSRSHAGCSTSGSGLQQWGIPDRETRSPPPRLRPNPGPEVCVTDRGCIFSSRPLELLCFLYPVTGQKLNPHRPALTHRTPSSIGSPCKRSLHSPLSSSPGPFWNRHFLNKDSLSKWLSSQGLHPRTMIYIKAPQHNFLILSLYYGTVRVLFCLNS